MSLQRPQDQNGWKGGLCSRNAQTGGGWQGNWQGLCARRARTIRMCSLHARSRAPTSCPPEKRNDWKNYKGGAGGPIALPMQRVVTRAVRDQSGHLPVRREQTQLGRSIQVANPDSTAAVGPARVPFRRYTATSRLGRTTKDCAPSMRAVRDAPGRSPEEKTTSKLGRSMYTSG